MLRFLRLGAHLALIGFSSIDGAQTISDAVQLNCSDESRLRSKSAGGEGFINFENGTGGFVQVFKLDTKGARKQYGTLNPQYAYQEYTEVGDIWVMADPNGKTLAAFQSAASRIVPELVTIALSRAEESLRIHSLRLCPPGSLYSQTAKDITVMALSP